jgi:hypothetical protein
MHGALRVALQYHLGLHAKLLHLQET